MRLLRLSVIRTDVFCWTLTSSRSTLLTFYACLRTTPTGSWTIVSLCRLLSAPPFQFRHPTFDFLSAFLCFWVLDPLRRVKEVHEPAAYAISKS